MNPKPTYIIPNPLEDFVDYRLQSESTEHVALAMDMLLIDRVLQDFVGVLGIEAIHLTERSINQVEVTLSDLGVFQQKATNEIHRWMSDDLTIGYITRTDPTPRQYPNGAEYQSQSYRFDADRVSLPVLVARGVRFFFATGLRHLSQETQNTIRKPQNH